MRLQLALAEAERRIFVAGVQLGRPIGVGDIDVPGRNAERGGAGERHHRGELADEDLVIEDGDDFRGELLRSDEEAARGVEVDLQVAELLAVGRIAAGEPARELGADFRLIELAEARREIDFVHRADRAEPFSILAALREFECALFGAGIRIRVYHIGFAAAAGAQLFFRVLQALRALFVELDGVDFRLHRVRAVHVLIELALFVGRGFALFVFGLFVDRTAE